MLLNYVLVILVISLYRFLEDLPGCNGFSRLSFHRVCAYTCVRACVHAMRVCMHACECVRARACVRACVCAFFVTEIKII